MIPQIAHIINTMVRAIDGAIKYQLASSREALKGDNMKTYNMANPEEVKAFIRECFSEIPEHPVHAEAQPNIETEESFRERQKDLDKHRMYTDKDWNRSGLGEF